MSDPDIELEDKQRRGAPSEPLFNFLDGRLSSGLKKFNDQLLEALIDKPIISGEVLKNNEQTRLAQIIQDKSLVQAKVQAATG